MTVYDALMGQASDSLLHLFEGFDVDGNGFAYRNVFRVDIDTEILVIAGVRPQRVFSPVFLSPPAHRDERNDIPGLQFLPVLYEFFVKLSVDENSGAFF